LVKESLYKKNPKCKCKYCKCRLKKKNKVELLSLSEEEFWKHLASRKNK